MECVSGLAILVLQNGCTPCKMARTLGTEVEEYLEPEGMKRIDPRGKRCSANGGKQFGGGRLDKVPEDCIWIRCDGDTGLYVLEKNPFSACDCISKLFSLFFPCRDIQK